MDGHEKPETKKCRKRMVGHHLKNELRTHCWIQLPATELKDLEEELETKLGNGHQRADPRTSIKMVELDADSHLSSHKKMNATTTFG
jgi:hypothetical protein